MMRKTVKLSLIRVLLSVLLLCTLAAAGAEQAAEQTIDMDLSAFSRGVTYAQMTQVCRSPGEYEGKLFRLRGKFNYSEANGLARIIFSDNTGCCELALVFQPAEDLRFPDDYPPLWGEIMITARLSVDGGDPDMPCRFTDAVIEWER